MQNGFGVHVETTSGTPVIKRGNVVKVYWLPDSLLPYIDTTNHTVDVTLRLLNPHTELFDHRVSLVTKVPNTGQVNITIPHTLPVSHYKQSLPPLVIEVGLNLESLTLFSLRKCSHAEIGCEKFHVGKHSSVKLLDLTSSEDERRQRCKEWAHKQQTEVVQRLRHNLPSCPCTEELAALSNSGFKLDHFSSLSGSTPALAHDVWRPKSYFRGGRLIDESYRYFLHRNASVCYRQRSTSL